MKAQVYFVLLFLVGWVVDALWLAPVWIILATTPFAVLSALCFFHFSRTGTPFRHPRSLAYRSPQMPWVFLATSLLGLIASLRFSSTPAWAVAFPCLAFYYALRFGVARLGFGLFAALFGLVGALMTRNPLGVLAGAGVGTFVALEGDLAWNWKLKRAGIVVPGPDPAS